MIDDEDSAGDRERAEAEALARAIEGEAPTEAPPDVVATATLLRAVGAKSELSSDRARAVYDGLEPAVEHYVRPRRSGALLTLLGLGASLAAAAALMLFATRPESPREIANHAVVEPPREPALPAPSAELLAAQAALGSEHASEAARAAFEREMRAYRAKVLRALKGTYPEQVGMLEPARRR